MKKLLLYIMIIYLLNIPAYAITLSEVQKGSSDYLISSHDKDRYAEFTIEGDTVYVKGRFVEDNVTDFTISNTMMLTVNKKFTKGTDGAFEGYYGGVPTDSYGYVKLSLASGSYLYFRIEYNNGWYFPVNGLDKYSDYNIENYITASDEVSAYYVCDDLDVGRTRKTLERLRDLAFEITEGVDDDYQKAKLLSRWVSENIYYDFDIKTDGVTLADVTIENVLDKKRTVCIGFAVLYAALLETVGIKAVNIMGGVTNEDCTYEELAEKTSAHEWVAFWYEDQNRWVKTDVVFDSNNKYKDGKFEKNPAHRRYFDMDSLALSLNHRADKAELRSYLVADEYVQKGQTTAGKTEMTSSDVSNTESRETLSGEKIPTADRDDFFAPLGEDLTVLYIAIAVLIVGIAAAGAILIITLKKNKNGRM